MSERTTETAGLRVLFLGGAKRVSIGRRFLDAGCRLYSYELTEREPIACIGRVISGLRWGDATVLEHLHEVVEAEGIDVMVPFVDRAIGVAVRYRERYGDVFVPAADDGALADAMLDKREADLLLRRAALPVPEATRYPLIAKPQYGSASQGILVLEDEEALRKVNPNDYLIQDYFADHEEFTVDCYVEVRTGRIVCISPRRRLDTVGGEVMATRTVSSPKITELTRRVLERLGLRGAVTVQFIRDLTTGRLYVMEINPRLGGGCVATCHAGCDLARMIVDDALGRRIEPREPRAGVLIKRYMMETAFMTDETD